VNGMIYFKHDDGTSELRFRVAASRIPGADEGLFAARPYKAHPRPARRAGGEERVGRRLFAKPAGRRVSAASTASTHADAKWAAIALRYYFRGDQHGH